MEHGCECKSWLSYDLPVVSNESKANNVPSVSVNQKIEENHASPFRPHRLAKEEHNCHKRIQKGVQKGNKPVESRTTSYS